MEMFCSFICVHSNLPFWCTHSPGYQHRQSCVLLARINHFFNYSFICVHSNLPFWCTRSPGYLHRQSCVLLAGINHFFFKLSAKIHGVMSLKTVALSPQPSAYCSHRLLFWRVRIIAKSDFQLRHVCLSVRVEHLCSHWTDFHEILYLRIVRKSVEKIRVSLKSDKKNSYFTRRPMYIYDISLNNSWSEKWPY